MCLNRISDRYVLSIALKGYNSIVRQTQFLFYTAYQVENIQTLLKSSSFKECYMYIFLQIRAIVSPC